MKVCRMLILTSDTQTSGNKILKKEREAQQTLKKQKKREKAKAECILKMAALRRSGPSIPDAGQTRALLINNPACVPSKPTNTAAECKNAHDIMVLGSCIFLLIRHALTDYRHRHGNTSTSSTRGSRQSDRPKKGRDPGSPCAGLRVCVCVPSLIRRRRTEQLSFLNQAC